MRPVPHERAPSRIARDDAGFTLIEVLIASVVLVVGLLAVFSLLDRGARATASSSQRDAANALAQEVVERSAGVRYDAVFNDLTDRRASSGMPAGVLGGTPAERLRTALAPDATDAAAITVSDTAAPWRSTDSWNVVRGNATYRLSYRACTDSDVIDGVQIAGAYDCNREANTDGGASTAGGGSGSACVLRLIPPADVPEASKPLDVRLQLLGTIGLQACLGDLPSGLDALSSSLCDVLNNTGTGTLASLLTGLAGPDGLLKSLQGALNLNLVGANASLCPGAIEQDLEGPRAGIATSTRVEVTVEWTDRSTGRAHSVRQTTVVRRRA